MEDLNVLLWSIMSLYTIRSTEVESSLPRSCFGSDEFTLNALGSDDFSLTTLGSDEFTLTILSKLHRRFYISVAATTSCGSELTTSLVCFNKIPVLT